MKEEQFLEDLKNVIIDNSEVIGIKEDKRINELAVPLGINFQRWEEEEIYNYLKGMYDMVNIIKKPWYYFESED